MGLRVGGRGLKLAIEQNPLPRRTLSYTKETWQENLRVAFPRVDA